MSVKSEEAHHKTCGDLGASHRSYPEETQFPKSKDALGELQLARDSDAQLASDCGTFGRD